LKQAEQWATQYLKDEMGGQDIKILQGKPHEDGVAVSGIFSDKGENNNFTLFFNEFGELVSKEVSHTQEPILRTTGH